MNNNFFIGGWKEKFPCAKCTLESIALKNSKAIVITCKKLKYSISRCHSTYLSVSPETVLAIKTIKTNVKLNLQGYGNL